jgi:hypothetical protein
VDNYPLPMKGQCWATPRGSLGLWTPAPHLLVFELAGHGEAGFVEPIVRDLERLSGSAWQVFVDAGQLSNYDSPLRIELTAAFRKHSERIEYFPVLLGSKIVAMGVTVANLALKGLVTPFTNRDQFLTSLNDVLRNGRIVGFSTDVLGNLPRPVLPSERPSNEDE